MSNTNYQAMGGGEGNVPPPAYAPTAPSEDQQPPQYQQQQYQQPQYQQPPAYQQPVQAVTPTYQQQPVVVAQQPVQAVPSRTPVTASVGALPPQYQAVPQNNSGAPPTYAYPAQAQQPIIMQPAAQPAQHTTTIIVAKPVYGAGAGRQPVGPVEPYQDLTVLSCLACLFCGWICGLGALMFSSNAQAAHRRGDYDEYRRQNANAKMCLGISLFVGIAFWIVVFAGGIY